MNSGLKLVRVITAMISGLKEELDVVVDKYDENAVLNLDYYYNFHIRS
jgi:hypothetical protein